MGKACSSSQDTWASAANQLCGLAGLTASQAPVSSTWRMGSRTPCPTRPSALDFCQGSGFFRPQGESSTVSTSQEALVDLVSPPGTSSLFPFPQQHSAGPQEEPGMLSAQHLGWLTPAQLLGFYD